MTPFGLGLLLAALPELLLGLAVLLLPGHRDQAPRGVRRTWIALALIASVAAAKGVVLLALGQGGFAVIHVLWIELFWVLPILGTGVHLAHLRGLASTGRQRLLATLAWAPVPILIWSTWIEPFDLRLETARIPVADERAGVDPVRIAVIADLQASSVGDHERAAMDLVMTQAPDLILLPGDLVQVHRSRFDRVAPEFRKLLAVLEAPLGVYAVVGNVDRADQLLSLFEGTRVQLLYNETVELEHGDRRITLTGVQLNAFGSTAQAALRRLERGPGSQDLRILLTHTPDVALQLPPDARTDLVVAGHTHGGQVVVPGFGPPLTLSRVPRAVARGGLHELDGRRVYVSRGVGCERARAPRIRFLAPPEISLLTLGNGPPRPGGG